MSVNRKLKITASGYKSAFTKEEIKLLKEHDAESLFEEIWINRVMLLRTVNKMNEMNEQLSFRDHLDALRAVSYATGRIAGLLQVREELSKPYLEVEKKYLDYFKEVKGYVDKIGLMFFGEEKWGEMQWDAFHRGVDSSD